MAEKKESLLVQAREQFEAQRELALSLDPDIPKIDRTKPRYESSGVRLFEQDPERYAAIVKTMAIPGCSQRWTCDTFNISPHTYRSIREREEISIATQKKAILSDLMHLSKLSLERSIELMPQATCKDSLIGVGISIDKLQLMSGDPTARVDHVSSQPGFSGEEEFNQFVAELFDEAKQAHARVLEPDQMGLPGQTKFPNSGAAAKLELPDSVSTAPANVIESVDGDPGELAEVTEAAREGRSA